MRLRLGLFALVSLVVFLISAGISSLVVDPENIGVRLALYVVALLAMTAGPTRTPQDAGVPREAPVWPGA